MSDDGLDGVDRDDDRDHGDDASEDETDDDRPNAAGDADDRSREPDAKTTSPPSTAESGDAHGEGDTGAGETTLEYDAADVDGEDGGPMPNVPDPEPDPEDEVPEDVRKYARFKKMDGAQYDRVNEFLRDRTYITAREWAIARLCADFRTETGVEMTKIGENLPELVPFMTDTYTPQAVNQARSSFDDKVRKAGATFLYGAMCDFYTAEELDDVMYEVTEVAKFLLEVEGVDLTVDEELEAEERISSVMREVREASKALRDEETDS
ncbi:DUF5806 family protein [Natrarchaeobaculum aegyptiacum]|uniref:Uncharacterized protein n=1 Tax=Natrarchaeobaculum aegyptiacum TaxID=745377 RepID=A0A2Z2HXY9_9EURY|nr:DUF5806 family protein [Natrarchaeobaculum aegyptiacum]ARS89874.1 hypothetical protein B1756_09095 [Natrarchaeobaculum aegyptiacum]